MGDALPCNGMVAIQRLNQQQTSPVVCLNLLGCMPYYSGFLSVVFPHFPGLFCSSIELIQSCGACGCSPLQRNAIFSSKHVRISRGLIRKYLLCGAEKYMSRPCNLEHRTLAPNATPRLLYNTHWRRLPYARQASSSWLPILIHRTAVSEMQTQVRMLSAGQGQRAARQMYARLHIGSSNSAHRIVWQLNNINGISNGQHSTSDRLRSKNAQRSIARQAVTGVQGATQSPLNIVFVAAEVSPWSKTGGLGDVVGGLPIELAKRGHTVMTIAPR